MIFLKRVLCRRYNHPYFLSTPTVTTTSYNIDNNNDSDNNGTTNNYIK